jgi:hypothetical protein
MERAEMSFPFFSLTLTINNVYYVVLGKETNAPRKSSEVTRIKDLLADQDRQEAALQIQIGMPKTTNHHE